MKKYIIIVLTALISVTTFAQGDTVKTDGTKYYLEIYDGIGNEKVLYHNSDQAAWKTKLRVADYFSGASNQLWSFEATEMYPGYFSIVSHDEGLTPIHHLMSWNWNAYFADNRDPLSDEEMQYRFVEAYDGYYILETIEKPAGLYGIDYTPGADAMNIKAEGFASFSEVKSADITQENMANKVFKFVEFDPLKLFEESLLRGDELHENNPDAPEQALFDLFYTLEKAREVRVFGTEGEMLAFQTVLDSILTQFNQSLGLLSVISDARVFIDGADVDSEVKTSFNTIVDNAEVFLNSDDLDYAEVDSVLTKLEDITDVVEAIVVAGTFDETLTGLDARLSSGLAVSIDNIKAVLADDESGTADYSSAMSHLSKTQALITEIISAMDLVAATAEFEDAKAAFNLAIEDAIVVLNTSGNTEAELDQALADLKSAKAIFQKALEAGDTPVVLINADFENDLADWIIDSPTPGKAYPENKGVDGSRSITCYSGTAYQMNVYQSLSDIPNGTYKISCFANVNADNSIGFYAESGSNDSILPIIGTGGLSQRVIEVEVENGMLQFGIKGTDVDNNIPGTNWVVFDQFEITLKSVVTIENGGFESELAGWTVDATAGVPYLENKGVDGSRSVTSWKGSEYFMKVSQTLTGLNNGTYAVSVMSTSNVESMFTVFGTSEGLTSTETIALSAELIKTKVFVQVTDGTLEFGVKGAGAGNTVPAGNWVVFDNLEVLRLPDVPINNAGFEDELVGWITDGSDNVPYLENKGIGGSRSVTCWQGSDYFVTVNQSLTNIYNGSYEVSAMATSNNGASFEVYGTSAGVEGAEAIVTASTLTKNSTLVDVSDGSLEFGIHGSGDGNTVTAGHWVVFDAFTLLLKSVVPTYEAPPPSVQKAFALDIESSEVETEVVYWQFDQNLNIRSTNPISSYAVYSITGVLVDSNMASENELSIPLKGGIYIVRVFTENGFVDTEKVVIR